jgi:hypothetical protein
VSEQNPLPQNRATDVHLVLAPYEYHMLCDELQHLLCIYNRDNSQVRHLLKRLAMQGGVDLQIKEPEPPAPAPAREPEPEQAPVDEGVKQRWWPIWRKPQPNKEH